jgi:hypothetical protein
MSIQVTFEIITRSQMEDVVQEYNKNKPDSFNNLEILDRAESGFQIKLAHVSDLPTMDVNYTIKQLRWKRKCLEPYKFYQGFDKAEIQLLYNALCVVFNSSHVILHT